ncbi:MAG: hypothetical protein ACRD4P_03405 [Bryobacteraceae bacterium]
MTPEEIVDGLRRQLRELSEQLPENADSALIYELPANEEAAE